MLKKSNQLRIIVATSLQTKKPKPSIMKWWHFFHQLYPRDFSRQGVSTMKVYLESFNAILGFKNHTIKFKFLNESYSQKSKTWFNHKYEFHWITTFSNEHWQNYISGSPFDHFWENHVVWPYFIAHRLIQDSIVSIWK